MNQAHEFPKSVEPQIESIEKKFDEAQAEIIKFSNKLHQPLFKQRDEVLKTVNKFWTKALGNCPNVMIYIDDDDKPVFDHLSQIRVERSEEDPREASIHFDFEENEYFSDKTLSRVFTIKEGAEPFTAEFDFPANVKSEKITINWKSDEKNQTKLRPTKLEEEDEFEPGSFFGSFFEQSNIEFAGAIADVLINDFYPRAIDYYTDKASEESDDDLMYDDEEDDEFDEEGDTEDEREIDLEEEEKRPTKKTKNA